MKSKNLRPRKANLGTRQQFISAAPAISGDDNAFQAALSICLQAAPQKSSSAEAGPTPRPATPMRWQDICSGALASGWSFLHARYKISTAKRLRVSETISLGEKRFVAIVAVEGQEFLIGGGVSGMSLLAQLGSVGGGTSEMGKKTSDSGCAL
jgi:hypothetical protein